jgi:hypothetical protein
MFRSPLSRFAVATAIIVGACCVAVLPATASAGPSITSVTPADVTTTPPASQSPDGHGWIG